MHAKQLSVMALRVEAGWAYDASYVVILFTLAATIRLSESLNCEPTESRSCRLQVRVRKLGLV